MRRPRPRRSRRLRPPSSTTFAVQPCSMGRDEVRQRDAVAAMSAAERAAARARAGGEMYLATLSVTQQARRLRGGAQPGPEYMADGRLFAESLRWAIRAGQLCELLAEDANRPAIAMAQAALTLAIPDAVDVRDALEHFDDYLLNVGRQQNRRPGDFSQVFARGGTIEVIAGPIRIPVDEAERLINDLAIAVLT